MNTDKQTWQDLENKINQILTSHIIGLSDDDEVYGISVDDIPEVSEEIKTQIINWIASNKELIGQEELNWLRGTIDGYCDKIKLLQEELYKCNLENHRLQSIPQGKEPLYRFIKASERMPVITEVTEIVYKNSDGCIGLFTASPKRKFVADNSFYEWLEQINIEEGKEPQKYTT